MGQTGRIDGSAGKLHIEWKLPVSAILLKKKEVVKISRLSDRSTSTMQPV
jgi:hypothetical protein